MTSLGVVYSIFLGLGLIGIALVLINDYLEKKHKPPS